NVAERTREFGMLRALGMTHGQVLTLVLGEAVIMGLLGSAAGLALGIFGARGLAQIMGQIMGTGIEQSLTPTVDLVTLSLGVGVGVTMLAALLPAIQAGRISPIAALRIRGAARESWVVRRGWALGLVMMGIATALLIWNPMPDDPQFRLGSMTVFMLFTGITLALPASVSVWERAGRPLLRRLYGASGTIGSRNIDRARVRTMLTVGALLIGVAMILVVRTMTASFAGDLTEWIAAYMGGDLYIHASVPLRADLARQIAQVEGVSAATPVHYQTVEQRLAGGVWQSLTYMAVDPASYSRVTTFAFADSDADGSAALARLAQGQAVLLSSVLAEKLDLSRGDTIQLRTRSGVMPFEVAETVVDFNNQGLVVTGNWHDLRRYFGSNEVSTILVSVTDPGALPEVQGRIEALFGKRYQISVESNAAIRDRISTLLEQAFSMFDMMGVLAVAVAALGVVNTLTMNVMERTREIGMLRAVGMTRRQVYAMVLAESALMGVIGGMLGLAFGILLSRIFMTGMTAMSGYRLTFTVPLGGVISGVVVALVVSQLAALMPARRASRTNVLEALRYE
ncbi:MAG: FtsX-like permease family protein, partial [Anaerolineae bacterium]